MSWNLSLRSCLSTTAKCWSDPARPPQLEWHTNWVGIKHLIVSRRKDNDINFQAGAKVKIILPRHRVYYHTRDGSQSQTWNVLPTKHICRQIKPFRFIRQINITVIDLVPLMTVSLCLSLLPSTVGENTVIIIIRFLTIQMATEKICCWLSIIKKWVIPTFGPPHQHSHIKIII